MNANDLLRRLVQGGALIYDQRARMLTLPMHGELITASSSQEQLGLFYFVEAGAEDQHHTHVRLYARAEVIHGRDVSLTNAHGAAVAYIAPIAEWPLQDHNALRERLAAAWQEVAAYREHFDHFIADCRPEQATPLHFDEGHG